MPFHLNIQFFLSAAMREWCIKEISDENVHLLNFIHQMLCMKCIHERRGVWARAKVIMKLYRNLLYNILQQLCLKTKHFEFSSAIHFVFFLLRMLVCLFICLHKGMPTFMSKDLLCSLSKALTVHHIVFKQI